MKINEEKLLLLLNATSKEVVDDILMTCFRFRYETIPKRKITEWQSELGSSEDDIIELTKSATALIHECLFNTTAPNQVLSSNFHPQLATLLTKIINARYPEWKQIAIDTQVSPSRLIDYDCRINTTTATNDLTNVNASSLLLSLCIQEAPTQQGCMPTTRTVQLELGPQELNTFVDGMLKIKEQLSTIQ